MFTPQQSADANVRFTTKERSITSGDITALQCVVPQLDSLGEGARTVSLIQAGLISYFGTEGDGRCSLSITYEYCGSAFR